MQSLHQEMDRQVAEINQKISKMEGNRLEKANTVPATGDNNLTDKLDNLEKLVGQEIASINSKVASLEKVVLQHTTSGS